MAAMVPWRADRRRPPLSVAHRRKPQRSRLRLHAAGGGAAARLPHLSARPRRLARLHRRAHRPPRHLHRPRELRISLGRRRLLALGLQHAALHDQRLDPEIRARPLAGAAAQREPAVQVLLPRHRAAALGGADRAVGHRLLVDLRFAVLDPVLGADRTRHHRPPHQFPRRSRRMPAPRSSPPMSGAASPSSRSRCSPACRPSRSRSTRRRRSTAPAAGSCSAMSRCRCSRRSSPSP